MRTIQAISGLKNIQLKISMSFIPLVSSLSHQKKYKNTRRGRRGTGVTGQPSNESPLPLSSLYSPLLPASFLSSFVWILVSPYTSFSKTFGILWYSLHRTSVN